MSPSGEVRGFSAGPTLASGVRTQSVWRARAMRVVALIRRIVGVPDYDTYLAFMKRTHPECTPMDARTFERERLVDKYARPGSRCC